MRKIKRAYPARRYLDPGELPARTTDALPLNRVSGQALSFPSSGGTDLARSRAPVPEGPSGPGVASHCSAAGLTSEGRLSRLQELFFSHPFLLVKTAVLNDFSQKVNLCTRDVNLKK